MKKNKDIIPDQFQNVDEASEFWDTHDAGDYEEYLRPMHEGIEIVEELPQAVLLEPSLLQKLKTVAEKKGVSLETLVNLWLEEKLELTSHTM